MSRVSLFCSTMLAGVFVAANAAWANPPGANPPGANPSGANAASANAASSNESRPVELFNRRIMPIFRSAAPSSCVQCHLASVDLKKYILPSHEMTFALLGEEDYFGQAELDNARWREGFQRAERIHGEALRRAANGK